MLALSDGAGNEGFPDAGMTRRWALGQSSRESKKLDCSILWILSAPKRNVFYLVMDSDYIVLHLQTFWRNLCIFIVSFIVCRFYRFYREKFSMLQYSHVQWSLSKIPKPHCRKGRGQFAWPPHLISNREALLVLFFILQLYIGRFLITWLLLIEGLGKCWSTTSFEIAASCVWV